MTEPSQTEDELLPLSQAGLLPLSSQGSPPPKLSQSQSLIEKRGDKVDGKIDPLNPPGVKPKMILRSAGAARDVYRSGSKESAYRSPTELDTKLGRRRLERKIPPTGGEKKGLKNVRIVPNSNPFPLGLKSLLLAILVAVIPGYFVFFRQSDAAPSPGLFSLYEEELTKMPAKYVNQTDRFWTTFLSSLEPILTTDDPDLPAVIMMAVPDDHHTMGLCFMQHFAEVLNKLLGVGDRNSRESSSPQPPSYVDGAKLSSLSPDEQKVKIDEEIRKIIMSNQRTVLVVGLEKLDPQAILIFHGYCDNSEAVFKDIAILFMVRVPEDSDYSRDEEVYAFLFRLWSVLGPAKTKALLARMANNVAIMKRISHFIC